MSKPIEYLHSELTVIVGVGTFEAAVIKTEQGSKCAN